LRLLVTRRARPTRPSRRNVIHQTCPVNLSGLCLWAWNLRGAAGHPTRPSPDTVQVVSPPRETLDEVLLSPRLALIALPGLVIDEVLGGGWQAFLEHVGVVYPRGWPAQDHHVLELRRDQIREGTDYRWLLRAAVTRRQPTMVGRVGFHDPPDADGVVEIGYRIDAGHRRQGFANECATRLIESAEQTGHVSAVRASFGPYNQPSLHIAERMGFHRIGVRIDEIDGLEYVFERKAASK
jgi:ribosomal-protein-alanine N-acetyltransferase